MDQRDGINNFFTGQKKPTVLISNKKIAGSSLVIAVAISLLIFFACMSFILLGQYNQKMLRAQSIDQRLGMSLESAINGVLGDTLMAPADGREESFVFEGDSVFVRRYLWGLYQGAGVKVSYGNFSRVEDFIYGADLPGYMKGCLYLADHQRPVTLVGSTRLAGDVFAPAGGLHAGYINQLGFAGGKLADGRIEVSGAQLPPVHASGMAYLDGLTSTATANSAFILPDSLINAFRDPVSDFTFSGPVYLQRQVLAGKIIVRSDTLIEVERAALLSGIILVAPVIRLKAGFRGVLQAFATRQLIVEDSCVLEYPSALVIINKSSGVYKTGCKVGRVCSISGTILSLASTADHHGSVVELQPQTVVEGVVFVNGDLSLGSSVRGTVAADWFMYTTPSTTYENYLSDVSIDRRQLSPYFVGSSFFNPSQRRKIIQWVY